MAEEELIVCPRCGAKRPKTDILCGKCGARLGSTAAPLEHVGEKSSEKPAETKEGAKPPEKPGQPAKLGVQPPTAPKKKPIIPILIIVAVIAIVAFFILTAGPTECPKSCDDGNPCTQNDCSESTGFRCTNDSLSGEQTGCSSTETCVETLCVSGTCQSTELDDCCGNDQCERGETCINCEKDCICEIGDSCTANSQCRSNNCVGGECKQPGDLCGNNRCDTGEGCDTCSVDCACGIDYECINNQCELLCGNGVCDSSEDCSSCSDDCGECKLSLGGNCTLASDCLSDICLHGVCRSNTSFCGDDFCDAPENCTSCEQDCCLQVNDTCNEDDECLSGYCVHDICRNDSTYCGDSYCDDDEDCFDDCGYRGDFTICTHALNCNGNDTMEVKGVIEDDEWDYGNATYCEGSTCTDIELYHFELEDITEDDANVEVTRESAPRDLFDVALGDCTSVGEVFICLDDID